MDNQTWEQLIELNKNFYKEIAQEFSVTRQYAWRGWGRVVEQIELVAPENMKILDIACGNGRFLDFLQSSMKKGFIYKGIDSNSELLDIARNKNLNGMNVRFEEIDVLKDLDRVGVNDTSLVNNSSGDSNNNIDNTDSNKINDVYNVICVFGFIHHIPSGKFRIKWLSNICKLLDSGGLLVLTFWRTDWSTNWSTEHSNRFFPANIATVEEITGINTAYLEEGDIFLNWNNDITKFRYVHNFSEKELKAITMKLQKEGLRLVDSFFSDGRQNNLNHYLIYEKSNS